MREICSCEKRYSKVCPLEIGRSVLYFDDESVSYMLVCSLTNAISDTGADSVASAVLVIRAHRADGTDITFMGKEYVAKSLNFTKEGLCVGNSSGNLAFIFFYSLYRISFALFKNSDDYTGVMLDAPLLFEAGLENRCDKVMLLVADVDIRIKRVCMRDNTTPEDVKNRIANQMNDAEKIAKADIIVDNSSTLDDLIRNIEEKLILI